MRRWETAVVVAVAGAACVAGLAMILPTWAFWRTVAQLGSPKVELRCEAVNRLRYSSDPRAPKLLAAALADPSPAVRRCASRAIARRECRSLARALFVAAEAETHAYTRLAVKQHWSDLVWPGGDARLQRWAAESDPWSRLAAAYGALRRGRPEAASALFNMAASSDPKIRLMASRVLRDACVPVMQAQGGCDTAWGDASDAMDPPQLNRLQVWWDRHANPDMLWRAARWEYDPPKEIRIVGKLFRNRERFARWLGLS